MKLSFRPKDTKTQDAIGMLPTELQREVTLSLARSALILSREARREAPKGHTTLTHSIKSRKLEPFKFEISAGVSYAIDVHEGREPGTRPPVADILDWIKIKNIMPDDPRFNQRDLAWFIAKSIELKGTRANPFMQRAAAAVGDKIRNTIDMGVRRALHGVTT